MATVSAFTLYEAFKSLKGLLGFGSTTPATTAPATLDQQVAGLLPSRDDEAIQLALDTALVACTNGHLHLERIRAVREILEVHQRKDWRKNLSSLDLTAHFEQVLISEVTSRQHGEGKDDNDATLTLRRRGNTGRQGQERVERKFDRQPLNYELTLDDPRVKHLLLVSGLVERDGVAKAKDYLLSAGLIKDKSLTEQTVAAASEAKEAVAGNTYDFLAARVLDAKTRQRIGKLAEGKREAATFKALEQKKKSAQQKAAQAKTARIGRKHWIIWGIVALVAIILWINHWAVWGTAALVAIILYRKGG